MVELSDDALLESRDSAWTEWVDWEHSVYYPRWYKQHNKFINPWLTVSELKEAQRQRQEMFGTWLGLYFMCVTRGLPSMSSDIVNRWKEISTPNGRRYVRE